VTASTFASGALCGTDSPTVSAAADSGNHDDDDGLVFNAVWLSPDDAVTFSVNAAAATLQTDKIW